MLYTTTTLAGLAERLRGRQPQTTNRLYFEIPLNHKDLQAQLWSVVDAVTPGYTRLHPYLLLLADGEVDGLPAGVALHGVKAAGVAAL